MLEIWVTIPNFDNYQISNQGRIQRIKSGPRTYMGRLLNGWPNNQGYIHVDLWQNKKKHRFKLHRLITKIFLGDCPLGKEVNHKDGNKANNRLENLEYVTRKENSYHAHKYGLILHPYGAEVYHSTLNYEQAKEIQRLFNNGFTQKKLTEIFSVSKGTIYNVLKNKHWSVRDAIN